MGTYLLKKYERQFYRSRLNPYSGKAVNTAHENEGRIGYDYKVG
jgi:hypothetical protein